MLGNAHSAVEFADLHDEQLGRFVIVEFCGNSPDRFCKKSETFFAGFSIVIEYVRQNYRVGESVRSVVHAAKAVGNAVYVTDISSRECKSGKIRGFLQVFSCLDVLTVAVGCLDIFYDKASGNDGRFGASSKIAVVDCRVRNSLVVNGVFDICAFQVFFDILEMLRLSQESVRHKEDVVYPVGLEMVRKFAQAPRAVNNLRFALWHKVYTDEKNFLECSTGESVK